MVGVRTLNFEGGKRGVAQRRGWPLHEPLNAARRGLAIALVLFPILAALLLFPVISSSQESQPAVPAVAPTQESAPGVEELVAESLQRSPTIEALAERLQAAREMVSPAGAMPDPSLELFVQAMGIPNLQPSSTATLEYRQDLPYPGKRKARREAAEASAAVRAMELEAARRTVAEQVRSLYGRIYALDQERTALDAAADLMALLQSTVSSRYSSGGASQEEVLKAQLESSRISERLADLEADRSAMVAGLNRLLDRPGESGLGRTRTLPEVTWPDKPLEQLALADSADVASKRAAVEEAARRVREAELDLRPDFSVGVGGGVDRMLEPVAMFRFGVGLPVWLSKKQRPLLHAAQRELDAAKEDLRDAEAFARSQSASLVARWKRDQGQIRKYRDAIIPQSNAALDAARYSYASGRGDFRSVIEDFNSWLEAMTQSARREADRFVTWAEVQTLVAPLPDDAGGRK